MKVEGGRRRVAKRPCWLLAGWDGSEMGLMRMWGLSVSWGETAEASAGGEVEKRLSRSEGSRSLE